MASQSIQTKQLFVQRLRAIIIGLVVIAVCIIGQLFHLQIINQKEYKQRAEHQYRKPVGDVFDRGDIYFTGKDGENVAAATIATGYTLAAIPPQISDPAALYASLAPIIDIDKDSFIAKASKKTDPYEEIMTHLSEDQAAAIVALHQSKALLLINEKWRFYPGNTMAAQTIGFVSFKDNTLIGRYGLEGFYNDVLSRTSQDFYVNFFAEIFSNVKDTLFKNNTTTGDVVTGIEPVVQSELETLTQQIEDKFKSDSVGAIVMDPYTGQIIAMAHLPNFDPNNYGNVSDISVYKNPFAESAYEMGSIVKPMVMAAGIDSGAVTPATMYFDKGSVVVGDRTIKNFDKRGRGKANMQDVLNQSLNTGMVFVEQHMGNATFKDYMLDRYKLGLKTGVDLPGEINGITTGLRDNNNVNYANAAFGQGIALTPLSIVKGFAILANGGYVITPHIASQIKQVDGVTRDLIYPKSAQPVLKPETIQTMHTMLTHVVDDGYHRANPRYTIAAKTGTAQVAKPNGQGYYTDRNLHSLVGFFPATNPRFVVYFYDLYPKGAPFAISSLGDSFFEMVQFLAGYYDIPPDR